MGILRDMGNLLFQEENTCLFCKENTPISESHICKNCNSLIEFTHKEIELHYSNIYKAYYSVLYNRFIRKNLHAFKFGGKSYLYKPFGEILLSTIYDKSIDHKIEAVAYVPTNKRKKAIRGYNQSELLAQYISKELDKPLLKNNLIKIKWTKEQNKLGKIERKNNLKGAFKVINAEGLKNKEILLIDDIITTGTTIIECSGILTENGVKKVYGLAITSSMKV
ncbi:ComF family protein [Schnuerera sp. xch1]|uniref:ComF family protein n=1 Tax=Schnuerera sp. xch1 TaxID=2874283 RepID=UPI001CC02643|nr:ComF family protein [Schnuerera sp. xch1]MBZ2174817.1 ComF family protein [Schnuerera sp. xch1]